MDGRTDERNDSHRQTDRQQTYYIVLLVLRHRYKVQTHKTQHCTPSRMENCRENEIESAGKADTRQAEALPVSRRSTRSYTFNEGRSFVCV